MKARTAKITDCLNCPALPLLNAKVKKPDPKAISKNVLVSWFAISALRISKNARGLRVRDCCLSLGELRDRFLEHRCGALLIQIAYLRQYFSYLNSSIEST
jgi:hypothetical protein